MAEKLPNLVKNLSTPLRSSKIKLKIKEKEMAG